MQYQYVKGSHESFTFEDAGNGYVYIKNELTDLYVTVADNVNTNGVKFTLNEKYNVTG